VFSRHFGFVVDGEKNSLSLLDKFKEENHLAIDSLEVLKDLLEGVEKWTLQTVEKFGNKKECTRLLRKCQCRNEVYGIRDQGSAAF